MEIYHFGRKPSIVQLIYSGDIPFWSETLDCIVDIYLPDDGAMFTKMTNRLPPCNVTSTSDTYSDYLCTAESGTAILCNIYCRGWYSNIMLHAEDDTVISCNVYCRR